MIKIYTSFLLLFIFITNGKTQTVNDIDGNVYPIITIGDQQWMGENLRVTHYRNGDPISSDLNTLQWRQSIEGAFAFFDFMEDYQQHYGNLYNWYAVNDERGLCPVGWIVPGEQHWNALMETIDPYAWGNRNQAGVHLKDQRQVGSALQQYNTTDHPRWDQHNRRTGINSYSFSALPAGNITAHGDLVNMGKYAYFWSAGAASETQAWARVLLHKHAGMSRSSYAKNTGFSIRCIRDEGIELPPNYTLSLSLLGQGTISPAAGSYSYAQGTQINVTATPASGWEFVKWVVDGEEIFTTSHTVNIQNDITAIAHFAETIIPVQQFTLTVNSTGQGTTSPAEGEHMYDEGTDVNLTATPASGWEFEKWVVDEVDIFINPHTISIQNDVNATAHFIETVIPITQYTLLVSVTGQGSTHPAAGEHTYDEGTEVNLTATPASGWEFEKWVVDGAEVFTAGHMLSIDGPTLAHAHFIETTTPGLPTVDFNGTILFVHPVDHNLPWGGDGITTDATSDTNGQSNTQIITEAIENNQGVSYAAEYCSNLVSEGFDDWYLPSKDELNALYLNRNSLGGFNQSFYWSSTEFNYRYAWYQSFDAGFQDYEARKFNILGVRCIRKN